MLKILIVEDDELFAVTLRHLVELNPLYQVTAVVRDTETATASVADRHPDLALVDLHLANGDSGYHVAEKLVEADVACLFITGEPPREALPELAVGCLVKPFGEGELSQALRSAEDMIRGRQPLHLRANRPDNLRLYGDTAYDEAPPAGSAHEPSGSAEAPEETPAKARLLGWVRSLMKR
jgi:DNA-binding NarL/FixJ family response regulator